MASFNKVILAGNLTRDPELRYTPKGTAVATLGLAINRTWKTETNETREEVTFVDVEAFGRQGEVLSQYLRKGRPILIEGRLKFDQWEDKQTNQKRYMTEVVANDLVLLGGRVEAGEGGGYSRGMASGNNFDQRMPEPEAATAASPISDDDIPF